MAAWESVVEKTVVNRAERAGYFVRKVEWPGRRGAPDRVFIGHGVTVWIEFKQKGEEAEPHQRAEHDRMRAAGALVYVCHTEDEAARVLPGYVV